MGKTKSGVVIPVAPNLSEMSDDYMDLINDIKESISQERLKIVLTANRSMILLYWNIGNKILKKQQAEGWGAKVIDRLSIDLKEAFPEMKGFSPRNLKYMRKFAESWPDIEIVQRTIAQIPWGSNTVLMDKLDNRESRLWYACKLLEYGWSKDILNLQISTNLIGRQGNAVSNFEVALPPTDSDLASHVFKDPYLFDFLGTDELRRESELEEKLTHHIEKFLLELSQGFAFVGRQVQF